MYHTLLSKCFIIYHRNLNTSHEENTEQLQCLCIVLFKCIAHISSPFQHLTLHILFNIKVNDHLQNPCSA